MCFADVKPRLDFGILIFSVLFPFTPPPPGKLGVAENKIISKGLCDLLHRTLHIESDRYYCFFSDYPRYDPIFVRNIILNYGEDEWVLLGQGLTDGTLTSEEIGIFI